MKHSKNIIFLLICILNTSVAVAQVFDAKFRQLSIKDGLSQGTVISIIQDSKGFMWFGTRDGLNRFDGYQFTIFRNNPEKNSIAGNYIADLYEDHRRFLWIATNGGGLSKYDQKKNVFTNYVQKENDTLSLSSNYVNAVCEDNLGNIWVGTNSGLDMFDNYKQTFTHFKNIQGNIESLAGNTVRALYKDSEGFIWAGTQNGLSRINPVNKKMISYKHNPLDTNSLSSDDIFSISEDKSKKIWVATANGLTKFDVNDEIFVRYYHNPSNYNSLLDNYIRSIYIDNMDRVWVGTSENGISVLNQKTNTFSHFQNNPQESKSLSHNNIRSLYEDKFGTIWIGTYDGVCQYSKTFLNFKHFFHNPYNQKSLSNNSVWTFFEDKSGHIWIGTSNGLNKMNQETGEFERYINSPESQIQLSANTIDAVFQDNHGYIWVGTWGSGIDKIDLVTKKITNYKNNPQNRNSLSSDRIRIITEDNKGRIWIGTYQGGLCRYRNGTNDFVQYKHDPVNPQSISNNSIWDIRIDNDGKLWIATDNGLNLFDPEKEKFKIYFHDEKDSTTIGSNMIQCIQKDRKGEIWIGSYAGIAKYNRERDNFKNYTEKDGLANNVVYGILEDKTYNLWISTNRGLSKFNLASEKFKNFDINDGLQSNEFSKGAFYKNSKGVMFFGGVNGFNTFIPDSITDNNIPPIIVLTDLRIFNKSILPAQDAKIHTSITYSGNLELSHTDDVIGIEFAALHYINPKKNIYEYKLENFDNEWVAVNSNIRIATYTNLNPGDYVFKVRAANSDGVWNEQGLSLKIKIKPPFWGTLWFRITVGIFLIIIIYLAYQYRIKQIEKQKIYLEQQVKERTEVIRQKSLELAQHAEKLRISNIELQKLSAVASKTDNAILITDANGDFIWVNEGYTRMYGYTYEDLVNKISKNIFGRGLTLEAEREIRKCFREKKTVNYEIKFKSKTGIDTWVQAVVTPILDENNDVSNLIIINTDITKIKEAEAEIINQRDKIQLQNRNVKGSIKYALTIQQAFLPPKLLMDQVIESFIIHRPKDIVSGDFYWFFNIPNSVNQPEKIFVAVADCTGHGVPGAFMSMLGHRLLDEIVKYDNYHDTKEILEQLDNRLISLLRQKETDNTDGMDICLCLIERKNSNDIKITFSGAKRPLYTFNHEISEIITIEPDRRSIAGGKRRNEVRFTKQELNIIKGDLLYLTTDGYVDQNNAERKRFGTPKLLEILTASAIKPLDEQQIKLELSLDKFQGDEEQRDDIIIWGMKL